MEIEIRLRKFDNPEEEELTYTFLFLLMNKIDDTLYYTPDLSIKGKNHLRITLYRLPLRETYKIRRILEAELMEDGFIQYYEIRKSKLETRHKMMDFTAPGFSKKGQTEIDRLKNFNPDVKSFVGGVMIATYRSLARFLEEEIGKEEEHPLTMETLILDEYLKELLIEREPEPPRTEDQILRSIMSEPMYTDDEMIKEEVIRKRRRRNRELHPRQHRIIEEEPKRPEIGPNGFIVPNWTAPERPKKKRNMDPVMYTSKDSEFLKE